LCPDRPLMINSEAKHYAAPMIYPRPSLISVRALDVERRDKTLMSVSAHP